MVILAAAIAAAIALAVFEHDTTPFAVHVLIIAGLALVPLWLALALVRTGPAAALALMVISAILAEIGYFTSNNPWDDRWDNYARMGERIRNEVQADDKILACGRPDPAIVWYAGRDLPVASDIETRLVRMYGKDGGQRLWQQWMQGGRPLWVVASDRERDGFAGVRLDQIGSAVSVDDQQLVLFRRQTSPVDDTRQHGAFSGSMPER